MPQQNKGLYTRLLEGNERNTEYARTALPTSRYQLFKDIFTGKFGKIVKINLLTLLFFFPLLIVLLVSSMYASSTSVLYPFGANLGVGYPAMPNLQGTSQWLAFQNALYTGLGITAASVLASVGLAGGMYAIRNMIWTEGVFVVKDFWRGVKLNYKNALQAALFFSIVLTVTLTLVNLAEFNLAFDVSGGERVWLRISQVVSYIVLALAAMMTLWMIALGVNYKMGLFTLIKNSFLMSVGMIPQTVFFGVVALLPFALFLIGGVGSMFFAFGLGCVIFFSFSFALLVWLDFAQWVFDRYLNPKTQPAKNAESDKTLYNKGGTPQLTGDDSASVLEYQRSIVAEGRSRLMSEPIKPLDDELELYELPQAFTREDLKKLKESKNAVEADLEEYANAHKNDVRFQEYNEQFAARERALQEQENKNKKGKKKKK